MDNNHLQISLPQVLRLIFEKCVGTRGRACKVAGLATLLAIFAVAAPSWAKDVCSGVPECQAETKPPLKLKAWQTKGWAWYCANGYPYYYNWSKSGHDVSVIENTIAEGENPSKFDALMTNWALKKESVTITLGCSKISRGSSCTSSTKDPKCPIIKGPTNSCSKGPSPACIQTWEEDCNGVTWYCTDDALFVWCNC